MRACGEKPVWRSRVGWGMGIRLGEIRIRLLRSPYLCLKEFSSFLIFSFDACLCFPLFTISPSFHFVYSYSNDVADYPFISLSFHFSFVSQLIRMSPYLEYTHFSLAALAFMENRIGYTTACKLSNMQYQSSD